MTKPRLVTMRSAGCDLDFRVQSPRAARHAKADLNDLAV
jgi:hypothetical protein